MASEDFKELRALADSFNRESNTQGDRDAYLAKVATILPKLSPGELYQHYLLEIASAMGGTAKSRDAEIAGLCGSNDVADKLTFLQNFFDVAKHALDAMTETNARLLETIDALGQAITEVKQGSDRAAKLEEYEATAHLQPPVPPTLQ